MVLVSDKEGHYLKVNHINTCAGDGNECSDLTGFSSRQVKSFEKDRQSEKRIPESDLLEHFIQKSRTKLSEERNRWRLPPHTLCPSPEETSNAVFPLVREISESASLQNPKGSLLGNSGTGFSSRITIHVLVSALLLHSVWVIQQRSQSTKIYKVSKILYFQTFKYWKCSPSGRLRSGWVCFFIRFGEMCLCISVSAMDVNGCRQNESLIKTSQHSSPSVIIWRRQKMKQIQH